MELQEFTENAQKLRMQMHQQAMHYLGSSEDSDDVVQEAFIKLWLKRKDIGDFDKMRNLASIVVRNISLNMVRNRRFTTDIDNCTLMTNHSDAHKQLEDKENHQRLQDAITSLTDKQRALIRMRNVENLSYAEIAKMLGTSESSVRAMICKARAALINKMQKSIC